MNRAKEKIFSKFKKMYEQKAISVLTSKYSALSGDCIKDIIQDSYIVLYRSIEEKKISELYYPYFLRTCINLSLKAIAKQSAHVILGVNNDTEILQKNSVSLSEVNEVLRMQEEEDTAINEKKELVHRAFGEMATRCKDLLWSFYADELSWATIACQYGLKDADSAKSAASRCRKTFKEKYSKLRG